MIAPTTGTSERTGCAGNPQLVATRGCNSRMDLELREEGDEPCHIGYEGDLQGDTLKPWGRQARIGSVAACVLQAVSAVGSALNLV